MSVRDSHRARNAALGALNVSVVIVALIGAVASLHI